MSTNSDIPERLFISGTDTGVGKTVLSAVLCAGLSAGYWKPIQAGTEPSTDSECVRNWTGLPESHFYPERYCLKLPMSPHAASEREGVEIELDDFDLPRQKQQRLIVEGAGGLMVPLNRKDMMLDLIGRLGLPVLLAARSGLGTINHTLMSIRMLKDAGEELWGVVLNGPRHLSNEEAIRNFGGVKRLFSLLPLEPLLPGTLKTAFDKTFHFDES